MDRHLHLFQGKRAGEQGVSLKARLLFVSWIKVDGVLKYKAEPKPAESEQDAAEQSAASAPAPQEEPTPEVSEPIAEPADEAADAQAPALAESF